MSSTRESIELQKLLSTFDVASLGEGDINAGANVLAAMAVTLANVAPADDSILHPDGTPARLGNNLLIHGALSAGLVVEEAITEVGRRQSNLADRLTRYCRLLDEQKTKPVLAHLPTGPAADSTQDLFAGVLSTEGFLFGTPLEAWDQLMSVDLTEQVHDLAARPKFMVSAARPKDLESQLTGLRPGHPLIHLGINRPSDLAAFADPGAALVEGRYTLGNGCETIRGNILLTDPLGLLGEAAKAPDEGTLWLRHFLWLSDGKAGPDAPATSPQSTATGDPATILRFRRALGAMMSRRVDLEKTKPSRLRLDTRSVSKRWLEFLQDRDRLHPGILGAARNLPSSLALGLGEMCAIENPLPLTVKRVEAFARFLVRRAVNARATILRASELARWRTQIRKVYTKLKQGHQERQVIYGKLKIPAHECDACLEWLEEAGVAQRIGGSFEDWTLLEGARLDFSHCQLPLLEV